MQAQAVIRRGKILRTTATAASDYFDIVAGPPAQLTVIAHAPFATIAGTYGDEAAILQPHPAVGLADQYLNPITGSASVQTGSVIVAVCVDGSDMISSWPTGICACGDAACLQPHMASPESMQAYAGRALEGSFEAEFEEASATFGDLRAKLARDDNRLVCPLLSTLNLEP